MSFNDYEKPDNSKINKIDSIENAYNYAIIKNYKLSESEKESIINKCFEVTNNNCFLNPETNEPFERCFHYRSKSKYGNMCRIVGSLYDQISLEQKIASRCNLEQEYYKFDDCKCINKDTDFSFKTLKEFFEEHNYKCWFKPCSSGSYLVYPNKNGPLICDPKIAEEIKLHKEIRNLPSNKFLESYDYNTFFKNQQAENNIGIGAVNDLKNPTDTENPPFVYDDNKSIPQKFFENNKTIILGILIIVLFLVILK